MPGDPGETWSALTFSLNRVDRADRTTPLSNVSVTNEIVAGRRLFPLARIILMQGHKVFCYPADNCGHGLRLRGPYRTPSSILGE
jgi:hypothetical protein